MQIRIVRVPPSRTLEGIDLRPYRFEEGHIYDVDSSVAKVLVMWEYAEGLSEQEPSSPPRTHARIRRKNSF